MSRKLRTERRRKDNVIDGNYSKLGVRAIPEIANKHNLAWVNDVGSRVQDKYHQDWDYVTYDELVHAGDSTLSGPNKPTGNVTKVVSYDGTVTAYLMKKQKNFYDVDYRDKQRKIDETDKQLREGDLFKVDEQYGKVKLGRKTKNA